jgi:CheY-like chemotaxis protein
MSYHHLPLPLPLHIAIIDDQREDIRLIEQGFIELQYQVRVSSCEHGPDGALLLMDLAQQSDCPDLVLIDIRMPRTSGFEVLRQLRLQGILVTTPIIMMTSQLQPGYLECATALGACDLLVKPRSMDDLLLQLVRTINLHCPFQLAGRDAN